MRYDYYLVTTDGTPMKEALTKEEREHWALYFHHRRESPTVYANRKDAVNAIRRQKRSPMHKQGVSLGHLAILKITIPWNGMESA